MLSPTLHRLVIKASRANTTRSQRPLPPGTGGRDVVTARRGNGDGRSTVRFVSHYVEMVVVMFLGMYVLMAPTGWALGVIGTSWSGLSPAMNVFTMALTMTVPMVAWMRYRGHAWRANLEMAASMLIPTFVVMTLLSAQVSTTGALMVPEHAAMLICMLAAMLLRRDQYSCAAHGEAQPVLAG
jgi:hypothetical protein